METKKTAMKTFTVIEKVCGYDELYVEAENEKAAIEKANQIVSELDYGDLKNIEWENHDIQENLSWTLKDGILTIAGNGSMIEYFDYLDVMETEDDQWAPWDKNAITSVVIENGVTDIAAYAFAFCQNLTSVQIPESVTIIGSSAFEGCNKLTSVTIPKSVKHIGPHAFRNCYGPTGVEASSKHVKNMCEV